MFYGYIFTKSNVVYSYLMTVFGLDFHKVDTFLQVKYTQ